MGTVRSLHCLGVKFLIFLSFFAFLVTSETPLLSGDESTDDLLTGHVQIKRDSLPTEVLPCLKGTVSDCVLKHSQWNNVHCRNNSFGMYTNANKFVSFGVDPLGIIFPTLFFNPLSSYSKCSSDSDEKLDRIEALLKANAEANMNITLLEQLLKKLQLDKDELEEELTKVKQTNLEQRAQIHIFKVRAERLEEVHQECTASNVAERNTSSIALRTAQDHITQLKVENALLMKSSSKCSLDLTSCQELLSNAQNRSHENELELARCSISLTSSQESEAAVRKELVEEEEEHSKNLKQFEEERKILISEKQNAQASYVSCDSSLKSVRSVHEQIKQNYDKCLENAARTNVELQLCTSALSLCRGNHSVATNAGELCEQDRKRCLSDASYLNESLAACESNADAIDKTLKSLKANEQKLTMRSLSLQSELENVNRLKNELNSEVTTMKAKLEKERSAFSDADAQARTCSLDLVSAKASLQASQDRAREVSENLGELREKYTTLSNKKFHIEAELSAVMGRCTTLKRDYDRVVENAKSKSLYLDRLELEKLNCGVQLNNVSKSLSIVQSQRDECLGKHHKKGKEIDQWRTRYEEIEGELATSNLKLANCTSRLNLLSSRFKSLEEEADEVQALNVNLNDRLKSTLETMSSMTHSNEQLRETISVQMQAVTEAGKELERLKALLETEKNANINCTQKLHNSKAETATLSHKVSKLTGASDALQKDLDRCSQELNETQLTLQEQKRLHAGLLQRLQKVQGDLKVANNLRLSAQTEAKTLERQLDLCRGNHSESVSESLAWQQQLIHCQKELAKERADCLRKVEVVEEQYTGCQIDLKRVTESLNATISVNERCQSEKNAARERIQDITRSYQASVQEINVLERRISSLEMVIRKLQGDSRTFKNRLIMVARQHELTQGQLTRCRESKDKQQLQLLDITEDLEECHTSAKASNPSPWEPKCPSSDQGSYRSSSFGCLLVTRSAGSQQEVETLCGRQAGGRLVSPLVASLPQLQQELAPLLAAVPSSAFGLWLEATLGADGKRHCQGLRLPSETDSFAVVSTFCSVRLQGLCVTQHEVDFTHVVKKTIVNSTSEHVKLPDNLPSILDQWNIH